MKSPENLKPAKTCYSHLGGKLGTLLMDTFIEKAWIAKKNPQDRNFFNTAKGEKNL